MPNNAKNLDEMKQALYKAFNKAMDEVDYRNHNEEKLPAAIKMVTEIAEKITGVEVQIALIDLMKEAKAKGGDLEIDLDKRTIRSSTQTSTAAIKRL